MVDYLKAAAAFRAKAAKTPYPEEAKTLIEKAEALEKKYGNRNSTPTNHTTTTSRDGFTFRPGPGWEHVPPDFFQRQRDDAERERRRRQAEEALRLLLKQQWQWNREYYDRDGNPYSQPDPADLVEEDYQTDPDPDEDEDEDPTGEWYT